MPDPAPPVWILKFGGSALADADRVGHAADLLRGVPNDVRAVIVVAALDGVTDALRNAADQAPTGGDYIGALDALRAWHEAIFNHVVNEDEAVFVRDEQQRIWDEVKQTLADAAKAQALTPRGRDTVLAAGERLSVSLVAAALRSRARPAIAVEAARFIRTDEAFGRARVELDNTTELAQAFFAKLPADHLPIVPGFIGATADHATTTLGPAGGDYTAAVLAHALGAEQVLFFADKDGLFDADPTFAPDAEVLGALTAEEAARIAATGPRRLHPHALRLLAHRDTPLWLKSALDPDARGTLVYGPAAADHPARALATFPEAALLTLRPGLDATDQALAAATDALLRAGVSSLAAAHHAAALTFAVAADQQTAATDALQTAFPGAGLETRGNVALIGVIARALSAARHQALRDVLADDLLLHLYTGADPTFALPTDTLADVLPRLRAALLSDGAPPSAPLAAAAVASRDPGLFVYGTGAVGEAALQRVGEAGWNTFAEPAPPLIGVADAWRMAWVNAAMPAKKAVLALDLAEGTSVDQNAFVRTLRRRGRGTCLVDVSDSETLARQYPALLADDIAIVSYNPNAYTLDYSDFIALKQAARQARVPFRYHTAVSAAIPALTTVQALVRAGTPPVQIDGVPSGAMALVFNLMHEGRAFSEAVRVAQRRGLMGTEARIELSGAGLAQPLLMLAREMGLPLNPEDLVVDTVVPDDLLYANDTPDAFLAHLPDLDAYWRERVETEKALGKKLVYAGRISGGHVEIGVEAVADDHPLYTLDDAEVVLRLYAQGHTQPFVLRGPAPNPEAAARHLLADAVAVAAGH